jgi:hypothetical protein
MVLRKERKIGKRPVNTSGIVFPADTVAPVAGNGETLLDAPNRLAEAPQGGYQVEK